MDDLLEKNLGAMREWSPGAAEMVGAARVSDGFLKTVGADGTGTFMRAVEEGGARRVEWLGGTALPRAAAGAMTADMSVDAGAMGLGIGSGYEWLALLGRMGGHQALFVYEPDARAVRMVMEVCDLSEALRAGRLVLLVGDGAGGAEEQLSKFLRGHVGFDVPTVMQQLPSMEMGERQRLRVAAEGMIRRAMMERTALGTEVAGKLGAYAPAEKGGGGGAVVAFPGTGQWLGQRLLGSALRAAKKVREVVVLPADRHGSASVLGRMEAIARHRPARVEADYFRGVLGGIPKEVGVRTWVPPLAPYSYFAADRFSANGMESGDRVVVHSAEHKAAAEMAGIGKERVEVVLPGVSVEELAGGSASGAIEFRVGVVMVGDLFPVEAKAYGFELPTHQAIWEAAKELIAEDARGGGAFAHRAEDLLRRAQRKAKATLDDAVVIAGFERVLRHSLIRAVGQATVARMLAEAGLPVKVVGRGWPEMGNVKRAEFGTAAEMFAGAAAVVAAEVAGIVDPLVIAAMGMGVAAVSAEHPHEAEVAGMGAMFEAGVEYVRARNKDLVGAVKGILQDAGRRNKIAEKGREKVMGRHTWEARGVAGML